MAWKYFHNSILLFREIPSCRCPLRSQFPSKQIIDGWNWNTLNWIKRFSNDFTLNVFSNKTLNVQRSEITNFAILTRLQSFVSAIAIIALSSHIAFNLYERKRAFALTRCHKLEEKISFLLDHPKVGNKPREVRNESQHKPNIMRF